MSRKQCEELIIEETLTEEFEEQGLDYEDIGQIAKEQFANWETLNLASLSLH
jgi:hypothetical protein